MHQYVLSGLFYLSLLNFGLISLFFVESSAFSLSLLVVQLHVSCFLLCVFCWLLPPIGGDMSVVIGTLEVFLKLNLANR